jgi:23S rRNA pseudouridine1911/1915/1917 synthase
MTEELTEIVPAALNGERIDRVVAVVTGGTRSDAATLVDEGHVRVNSQLVQQRSRRVRVGDVVVVEYTERPAAPPMVADPTVAVEVIFVDEHVIVVNKPAGLVVHPGAGNSAGTLVQGLLARYPELGTLVSEDDGDAAHRPGIVHRIDKGTSGLLMVARTADAYVDLVAQLGSRSVERRYDVLVWGRPASTSGLIDAPIGRSDTDPSRMTVTAAGREARTRYEVRTQFEKPDPLALLSCRLETGRTHQIRVHLAAIGHPVVGDSRYGGKNTVASRRLDRPFLHAATLGFNHPATGEPLRFTVALPADLTAVLDELAAVDVG